MKSDVIGVAELGAPMSLFRILARRWHRHGTRLFDPYRPERHYMRGPGPKLREKQNLTASEIE